MGRRRHHLTAARGGEFRKDEVDHRATDIGERIAVEEQKRRAAVALPQEIYGFGEGVDFGLAASPVGFERRIALRILAMLRASSCTRSSIEADDKLPTPVFEKSGAGL